MIIFYIYTILLELLYFLLSPLLFAIFRVKPDSERLAIDYPRQKCDLLVHAASVGEVNGIRQLLLELIKCRPSLRILVTTNTTTGRKTAQAIHPQIAALLSPLDILHLRFKQLSYTMPKLILIAETEIWPNLMLAAKLKHIPIVYVNARMSQKTYLRYMQFASILKSMAETVPVVCAQTGSDAERYSALFATDCMIVGNLKFSVHLPDFDSKALRLKAGYTPDDHIIVVGSSRPGEETLLLNIYKNLSQDIANLKLIIAPRHLDRLTELASLFKNEKVSFYTKAGKAENIHILDTMGHLPEVYAMCDVAIIGGSFYPFGGHNPLEAAYYSKLIIMGPYFYSCKGTVELLKKANAILLSSAQTLAVDLKDALQHPELYDDYGSRAKLVLEENKDSLPKHIAAIERFLD
jgi:3-deoxy-D-manno-octulosonic-acid transferase